MASVIELSDKLGNQLKLVVNLGASTTAFKGIYFDGFFFWLVQDKNLIQAWFDSNFTGYIIQTIDISNTIGNAGSSSPNAICGDGTNLYLAFEYSFGSPISVQRYAICLMNKQGKLIKTFDSTVHQSPIAEYTDITFDELRMFSGFADGTGSPHISALNISEDAVIETSVTLGNLSLEYDGLQFYYMSSATPLKVRNRDYSHNYNGGALIRAGKGLVTYGNNIVICA